MRSIKKLLKKNIERIGVRSLSFQTHIASSLLRCIELSTVPNALSDPEIPSQQLCLDKALYVLDNRLLSKHS